MKNPVVKIIVLGTGAFVIFTAADIASKSIYTHEKIGLDIKALSISAGVGIITAILLMKYYKTS